MKKRQMAKTMASVAAAITIKCDMRETSVINALNESSISHPMVAIETLGLPIADFILCDSHSGAELLFIERKSVADLVSSLTDGRYEEQSFRLSALPVPMAHIVYVIEGSKEAFLKAPVAYSTMFSMNYYKGYSVYRTMDASETATLLLNMATKLGRHHGIDRMPFYKAQTQVASAQTHVASAQTQVASAMGATAAPSASATETNSNSSSIEEDQDTTTAVASASASASAYANVVKRVKKENITGENIGLIMLSSIPGVSVNIAETILAKFGGSLRTLMIALNEDRKVLNRSGLKITTATGQQRKIGVPVLERITNLLMS